MASRSPLARDGQPQPAGPQAAAAAGAARARHDEAAGVTRAPRVPRVPPLSPRSPSPPLAAMASRSGRWLATRSRSRSPLARDPSGGGGDAAASVGGGGAASVGGGGAASVGGGGAAAAASLLRIRIRDGVVSFVDDGALSEGAQVVMEVEPNSSGETIRTIRAYAEVGPIRWT